MTVTGPNSESMCAFRPRLIYYNDGHHFHGKRVEPPVSLDKLRQPVNEVLGTSVDLLVLGLGYGDVYFHDSKVGRVVGEAKEVWESYIDWRIMRMVQVAREKGTDQVREGHRARTANGSGRIPQPPPAGRSAARSRQMRLAPMAPRGRRLPRRQRPALAQASDQVGPTTSRTTWFGKTRKR